MHFTLTRGKVPSLQRDIGSISHSMGLTVNVLLLNKRNILCNLSTMTYEYSLQVRLLKFT